MAEASWLRQPRPKFSDLDPDHSLVRFDSNRFDLQYWNSTRALNLISRFKLFPRNHLQGGKRVDFLFFIFLHLEFIAVLNQKMPQGSLEVLLISAKGLENTDFLCEFLLDLICFALFFFLLLTGWCWDSCRCMWIYVAFRSYWCLVFHIVVWSSVQNLSFA